MDFPLVDLSKGDIDGQAEPLDELKPLKWSAVELRAMLNKASSQLEQAIQKQRACNAQIRKSIDVIMSYGSQFSEHKEEREAIIRDIEALRMEDQSGSFGSNRESTKSSEIIDREIESDVKEVLSSLVDQVSAEIDAISLKDDSGILDQQEAYGDFSYDVANVTECKSK